MRGIVSAALRELQMPRFPAPEDAAPEAFEQAEDRIDDAVDALAFILRRYHRWWQVARGRAVLRRTPGAS